MGGHRDETDCDCGLCEPASPVTPMTVGGLISGNLACEWPACQINVYGCRWGDRPCIAETLEAGHARS